MLSNYFLEHIMKYISSVITILLVLLPLTSIAGVAGGGRSFEDGLFWSADLDRNERLDQDEAKNVYNLADDEIFARFDEDANGSINRAEFGEFIQLSPWTDKFIHPSEK